MACLRPVDGPANIIWLTLQLHLLALHTVIISDIIASCLSSLTLERVLDPAIVTVCLLINVCLPPYRVRGTKIDNRVLMHYYKYMY